MAHVDRIRSLHLTIRLLVIKETHGVKLEKLFRGKTAMSPPSKATVKVRVAPASEPILQCD